MLFLQHLILVAISALLQCSATKVLPRAQHVAAESEAFAEIHNVMLRARSYPSARNAPISREWNESRRPVKDTSSESPLAAVKRKLLGTRYLTCDPGYGLCNTSLSCCPESDGCCDNGSCASTGEICCGNGVCHAGFKCCGNLSCAPPGSECCSDGAYCDPGLHCVILNGIQGCCENYGCTKSGPVPVPSSPTFTFTPVSITPTTLPSITPLSLASITIPTRSLPLATGGATYSYFTTTWTWYYYSYFMTTISPSIRTPTSSEVTTSTTFFIYATGLADADYQFDSITSAASLPLAITAPGYTDEVATPTTTSSSTTAFRAGGVAADTTSSVDVATPTTTTSSSTTAFRAGGVAASTTSLVNYSPAASEGVKRGDGFATFLLGGCLGFAVGILGLWL